MIGMCRGAFSNRNMPFHSSTKQHEIFKIGFGDLYPAADTVEALLAEEKGEKAETKRILDVGEYLLSKNGA